MTVTEERMTAVPDVLLGRLAKAAFEQSVRCELIATDGDYSHDGRCPHAPLAVKWEDGFLDVVCQKHGRNAEKRPGALVLWSEDAA